MDRCTVNIAKSQIGFLDVIISPAFETAAMILPNLDLNVMNIE